MKVTKKSNYRIVVEPKTRIFGIELSEDTQRNDLREMMDQIKRHVDNIHQVYLTYDSENLCSFCGLEWEVSEDDSDPEFPKGTPLCCHQAIDEYKESLSTK